MVVAAGWIDSHCHLEMMKGEVDQILAEAKTQGLELCLTIGTTDETNHRVIEFTDRYAEVFGALGTHPHYAKDFSLEHLKKIRTWARTNPKIVALGECGYDLHYGHSSTQDQKKAFYAQVELALELDLPLVIHARDADAQIREFLQDFKGQGLKGVCHSFTSSLQLAQELLEAGFYISFNGICTFNTAKDVRSVLEQVPLDRLLLETDAPFLSPAPKRGKPNVPHNVALVGAYVSDFLKIELDQLIKINHQNTLNCFERIQQTWTKK